MTNPIARDLDSVLEQTAPLWDDLRGARLFITGGTGFFGCWLLETLLWANARLHVGASAVVLTRDPARFARRAPHLASAGGVTLYPGDVRTFAFPAGRFTHVVHAAADGDRIYDRADRLRSFESIVEGTARTLQFAGDAGATRVLFTSSGAVYGRLAGVEHVSEDHPRAPDPAREADAYGEAKRAAEMLCALHSDAGCQATIARCFAFIGPYLSIDGQLAIGNFIRDALDGGPIRITGDGTPVRSYLYAADLAVWLWTILLRGTPLRPYNVGSPHALTIREIAERIARTAGGLRVEIARTPEAGAAAERYVPSTTRAETELGLRATVSIDEAVERSLAWHRQRVSA